MISAQQRYACSGCRDAMNNNNNNGNSNDDNNNHNVRKVYLK